MGLEDYKRKRDFKITREPEGRTRPRGSTQRRAALFVIQKHEARRLHYDLRLEAGGVLKSWAVTQEPLMDPEVRRLAIETEDHPMEYASFEGEIPSGEYGAGNVEIWDQGTFKSVKPVLKALEEGKLEILLKGRKLKGRFTLVRTEGAGAKSAWLFFKRKPRPVGLRIPEIGKNGLRRRG